MIKKNGWIRDCEKSCGFLIILATQPHQEDCLDVLKFSRRLCAS